MGHYTPQNTQKGQDSGNVAGFPLWTFWDHYRVPFCGHESGPNFTAPSQVYWLYLISPYIYIYNITVCNPNLTSLKSCQIQKSPWVPTPSNCSNTFQVSKAILRSEDGRLFGWDVLLPDLLRHGTCRVDRSESSLKPKVAAKTTHFSCFEWSGSPRFRTQETYQKHVYNKISSLNIFIHYAPRNPEFHDSFMSQTLLSC